MPTTATISVDEIVVRKGHDNRVVVSDMEQQRSIWFGRSVHKQDDLAQFFAAFGASRSAGIQVAENTPKIEIVFDKFHILRHLNGVLDDVRRTEYGRAQDK